MTNKVTKYGLMTIAAVLLVAMAFAGAASAGVSAVAPEHPDSSITVAIIDNDGTSNTTTINSDYENVWLIKDEANWKYITQDSFKSYLTNVNTKLVLTKDIFFTESVLSIGDQSNKFNGTIYGNGSKFINFTQYGSDAHGLINYTGDGCVLNNVHMYESVVSGGSFVGGLVSRADSQGSTGVHLCGCSFTFGNITASSEHRVGGLVSHVGASTKLWVNVSWVGNAYLRSAEYGNLGSMVGRINEGGSVYINDSWVNCSELHAATNTGGLIGYAYRGNVILTNASVRDCKIWSGDDRVGGLVGYLNGGTMTMNGCTVENCTISGKSNVGGLIGKPLIASSFTGGASNKTWVNATWVSGDSNLGSLFGFSTAVTSLDPEPGHYNVYTSTGKTHISVSGVDNSFNDTFVFSRENLSYYGIGSVIDKTPLTAGVHYGYGPVYAVTVGTGLSHGSLSATPLSGIAGTTIAVTATPDSSGYHMNWTYWHNESEPTVLNDITSSLQFTMPDKNVTVSGDFKANTYTVHFDANGGVGSMADMDCTYDQGQNLTANAFQRYNSNFLYWTYNGTKYYDTEFVQNLTVNQSEIVVMKAQWETYSTGGSSSGSTYLGSNSASYTPTQQPTVKPTVVPTVSPSTPATNQTIIGNQTIIAKPTTPTTTSKSPAPFVGILAGLGAAAVVLRLRK